MDLSILIPARNEEFLQNTIDDALLHREAETEIIAVLDGQWPEKPLTQNERVNIIYVPVSVGQRAAQNLACKLAKGKYVMKVDAHCSFDQGFDRKMLEMYQKTGDDVTMVPLMRNLHAFDWKCYHCGRKWYQDDKPEVCDHCGKDDKIRKKMVWEPRHGSWSQSYCFNATPQFNYFGEYKTRPEFIESKKKNGYTETMSLQGSCFMATRENYWKLSLCDENFGNWGNQGIEVACKTWLSGGRCLVNHQTWYSHMFRTKAGFSFPWPVSGGDQQRVKKRVRDFIWEGKWDKQIHPVSWLVERFWPIPGWNQEDLDKLKQNELHT